MTTNDTRVEYSETFTLSLTYTDPAVMPQSISTTVFINDTTGEYIHWKGTVIQSGNYACNGTWHTALSA